MADKVQEAIDAATKAAGELVTTKNEGPSGTAVALPAQKGTPMTMEDISVGSMIVDSWLKVDENGLKIGNDRRIFDDLTLVLKMGAVAPHKAIKAGSPAKYWRTYDNVSCSTEASWGDAVSKAQRMDPKAREYPSADLPFEVLEDILGKDGTTVIAKEGSSLGHSLSTTNFKNFKAFYNEMKEKGLETSDVKVKVGFDIVSKNGNTWGVLNFTFVDEA